MDALYCVKSSGLVKHKRKRMSDALLKQKAIATNKSRMHINTTYAC